MPVFQSVVTQLTDPDVFVSYAWVNSQIAIDAGHARPKDGAIGFGDPRKIKMDLENQENPLCSCINAETYHCCCGGHRITLAVNRGKLSTYI